MPTKQGTFLRRFVRQVADKYRDEQSSDRELLRRFVDCRDEAAFGVLVRRHGSMVLGAALRVLRQRQDAEDVSQAAFLILARKANRIVWRDSVATWLYEVAHRLARKAHSTAQRHNAQERRIKSRQAPDAMAEISARDLQAVLDEELRALPNKYRAPIILCCLEGKTRDEAAGCLGLSVASVKSRLEEGRELLRRRLERRGVLLSTALVGLTLSQTASAALPAAFANVTSRAALKMLAGQTSTGLVSANVAALIKGGIQAMFLTKLKVATAVATTVCILGIGAIILADQGSTQQPPDLGARPDAPRKTQFVRGTGAGDFASLQKSTALDFEGQLSSVRWSPDGKFIATVTFTYEHEEREIDGKKVKVGIHNSTVKIWDVQKKELKVNFGEEKKIRISDLAFSPDSKMLAMIVYNLLEEKKSEPYQIRLADLESGNSNKKSIDFGAGFPIGVAFSPDGKTLIFGGRDDSDIEKPPVGVIRVWDIGNDREIKKFRRAQDQGSPYAIELSPNGKLIATSESDKTVKLWDTGSGKLTKTLDVGSFSHIAFSRDGSLLATTASADSDYSVTVWEVNTGKSLRTLNHMRAPVCFAPDNKTLLTGNEEQKGVAAVSVWDIKSGELRQTLKVPGMERVWAITFSPDGRTLLTGAFRWNKKDFTAKSELRLWPLR
jgi:RNA polymerase sigma factor (sigma-70 family)